MNSPFCVIPYTRKLVTVTSETKWQLAVDNLRNLPEKSKRGHSLPGAKVEPIIIKHEVQFLVTLSLWSLFSKPFNEDANAKPKENQKANKTGLFCVQGLVGYCILYTKETQPNIPLPSQFPWADTNNLRLFLGLLQYTSSCTLHFILLGKNCRWICLHCLTLSSHLCMAWCSWTSNSLKRLYHEMVFILKFKKFNQHFLYVLKEEKKLYFNQTTWSHLEWVYYI